MEDVAKAAQTIAKFLQSFTSSGGLRLRFRVKLRGAKQGPADEENAAEGAAPEAAAPAEGAGSNGARNLYVEFMGPDTPLLTARNGEVLNALEHIATKILRLEPAEHDLVSFDANHFKANRERQMQEMATDAIEDVRATGRPYAFPAMTSRERRMLHLILSESGLRTASSGEGAGRYVVLYPEDGGHASRQHTANRIRENFRHR